ncbi:hypothetical protein [Nonomuraea sp. NPDC049758]|uniref:hypothetical protein n=1 Tax=Nonomuraea sp. NPDC049758 TaxID=3154360 RepID=UPI0034404415
MTDNEWERGPDAAHAIGDAPERLEGRVLLLYGSLAEIVTAHHPTTDPLRVPAAELAEQLGIEAQALPGRRFTATIGNDDQVRDARLID